MEQSIQNNMDSNLGLNAGTGALSILTTLYIVNNQIKPIKDDVNRLVGDVGEIIQQKEDIDQVKNDIKELMSLYSDREKKLLAVINRQERHIQFLTDTVMDLQVGVYRKIKLETKPIPSEFLPNRMTNGENTNSYREPENESRLKTTQRDYDDREYDRPERENNHREYDYQNPSERLRTRPLTGERSPVGRSSSERSPVGRSSSDTNNYNSRYDTRDNRDARYAVRDKVRRNDSRNGDIKGDVMSRINTLGLH